MIKKKRKKRKMIINAKLKRLLKHALSRYGGGTEKILVSSQKVIFGGQTTFHTPLEEKGGHQFVGVCVARSSKFLYFYIYHLSKYKNALELLDITPKNKIVKRLKIRCKRVYLILFLRAIK